MRSRHKLIRDSLDKIFLIIQNFPTMEYEELFNTGINCMEEIEELYFVADTEYYKNKVAEMRDFLLSEFLKFEGLKR